MFKKTKAIGLQLLLMSVALTMAGLTARAQQKDAGQPATKAQEATSQEAIKSDVKGEVEQLKEEVQKLQSLVQQQQQTLTEMQKRLSETDAKSQAALAATSSNNAAPKIITASLETTDSLAAGQPPANSGAASSTQAKDQSKPAVVAGWDENHAFLKSADGSFLTYLTGYAQMDFRGYQSGNHPPNTFLLRRARLSFEGKLAKYYDFKVEGDFADTGSTLLRDAFVRVHRIDELQATFGQFKEPFSQEELRSDVVQDFVERSLVNNLAPSRSPGLMFSGVLNKGIFEYQVGAFNGKGLLATNNTGTPEGVVRLRFAPWKNTKDYWTKGLLFGGAFAQGRSSIASSIRGLTESRSFTFFTPDTINGKILRTNGELTWLIGPAAIRAEYDQTNQARNRLGPGGTNLPGVVAKGYMGQFTYLLTGENKSDVGLVVPRHNLFDEEKGHMGFGAWELKLRYSNLQIADGTVKSNRADTFTFGANWYLNRFVKYLLDFGLERYRDPLRTPRPGDNSFFVVLSRVQVAF